MSAALAGYLRDAGPAYDGDKPWNKKVVARILENEKYTGPGPPPEADEAAQGSRLYQQTEAPADKTSGSLFSLSVRNDGRAQSPSRTTSMEAPEAPLASWTLPTPGMLGVVV